MNRDKIGTQTCYIHQCTKRYVDVHSMSVSQSCLCSFLCNPYIHFKFPKFFIYLCMYVFDCWVYMCRGFLHFSVIINSQENDDNSNGASNSFSSIAAFSIVTSTSYFHMIAFY